MTVNTRTTIGIYAPNISMDSLISLLYLQLSDLAEEIEVGLIKSKSLKFRMPELEAVVNRRRPIIMAFIRAIFTCAISIGATRFIFIDSNEGRAQRDSTAKQDKLESLAGEINLLQLVKIEIY